MPPQQISMQALIKMASFSKYLQSLSRPLHAGFSHVEEACQYLLMHAKNLVTDRIYPRFPILPYLDQLVPVLSFIQKYEDRFSKVNLGPQICEAVENLAIELQTLPQSLLDGLPTLPQKEEIAATASLYLQAYRDAIYRVTHDSAEVQTAFGLHEEMEPRNIPKLIRGLELFLQGAKKYPLYLQEAEISFAQVKGIHAQKNVLQSFLTEGEEACLEPFSRAQLLHAAIEYFFDRFSAAVSAKFFDLPHARAYGLKLIPHP